MVLFAVEFGLIAGWMLAPRDAPADPDRFAATATLVVEAEEITPVQVVLEMSGGEVLATVAARLGTEPSLLLEQVQFVPDNELGVVEIEASGSEPLLVASIATVFAEEIVASLDARAAAQQQQRGAELSERQVELRRQTDEAEAVLAAEAQRVADLQQAGDSTAEIDPLLVVERDALVEQYRLAVEEAQQLATADGPTGGVSLLRAAEAEPVSGPEYRRRLEAARARGEQVEVPEPPAPPSRIGYAVIGGLIALVASVAVIVGLRRVDPTMRTRHEAATAFGLEVIGEVPPLPWSRWRQRGPLMLARPRSRYAEAHRSLRTALLIGARTDRIQPTATNGNGHGSDDLGRGHDGNGSGGGRAGEGRIAYRLALRSRNSGGGAAVVLVASPAGGDGASTTAVGLAIALAEEGRRVLLLDADFRRGALAASFGVSPAVALADIDLDALAAHYSAVLTPTAADGLYLVATTVDGEHTGHPAALIAAQQAMIERAGRDFDVVVVDSAPLLSANDAAGLIPAVDLVVLVGRHAKTDTADARAATELVDGLGAPVAGVVYLGDPASVSGPRRHAATPLRTTSTEAVAATAP